MSAKKRLRSQRNRHTGRINAATGHILTHGESIVASDGTKYRRLQTGFIPVVMGMTTRQIPKYTYVRDRQSSEEGASHEAS